MKLRSIIAGAVALVISVSGAIAQVNPGTSPLSIAKGGTAASTASAARTSLGLAIGSDVQAFDADLAALAGLTSANNKCFYFTGSGTAATYDCSSFGRSVANAADAAALRTLAGAVIGTDVQAFDADLSALAANSTSGFWARTGAGTGAARTITGTASQITVTNGDGVSGNPTLSIPSNAALPGAPTTTTASPSDNSTKIATTAYVDAQVAGGVAGVASLNGQTGALTSYFPPQGRLTLQTGVPVMTTTQSAKTTIYYTPYHGNMVPIYDGTNMVPTAVAEISVATTDTTKNPAAIGASKVNDWFVWNDGGTIRIGHGPDWTNDTTRSAGTALTLVNGIYLNNASITNGPAASRGTYVGTTRSNGSSQLDYILGGSASGGTAGFLGVWNAYNRVRSYAFVLDNGTSYTYSSGTVRQARASAGNQVTIVSGLAEDAIDVKFLARQATAAASGAFIQWGIGLDTTTAYTYQGAMVQSIAAAVQNSGIAAVATIGPQIGAHVISANENGDGTNSNTFNVVGSNSISVMMRN